MIISGSIRIGISAFTASRLEFETGETVGVDSLLVLESIIELDWLSNDVNEVIVSFRGEPLNLEVVIVDNFDVKGVRSEGLRRPVDEGDGCLRCLFPDLIVVRCL